MLSPGGWLRLSFQQELSSPAETLRMNTPAVLRNVFKPIADKLDGALPPVGFSGELSRFFG